MILFMQVEDLAGKQEIAALDPLRRDNYIQFLEQELLSMKGIQNKCEILENENKELKQELENLKYHMATNMIEKHKIEAYKWDIEQQGRQAIAERLKEVDPLLQVHLLIFNVP